MTNSKYRCDEKVFNKKKGRYHRCNNILYRYLQSRQLCWCHYNKISRLSIVNIQKIYRGYKCRRYLEIYKKLPNDIQMLIKYNISKDYYNKLYCNSIYKILNKRYNNFNKNIIKLKNEYKSISNIPDDVFINYFNLELYDIYYLHDKYFNIIRDTYNISMLNNARYLHILSYEIVKKISNIAQKYFYNTELFIGLIDNKLFNKLRESIFFINSLSEKTNEL